MLSKFRRARLLSHGFLGSLALILAAGSARADYMHWDQANGLVWNGYFSSPYYATDQSTNLPITLYCLDFNYEINPPVNWQANLNLLSPANISQFQYGGSYPSLSQANLMAFTTDNPGDGHAVTMQPGSDAYHRYLEAAWLFTNMIGAQAQGDSDDEKISQVAAWLLFVDSNPDLSSNTDPKLTHIDVLEGGIEATAGTYSFVNYVGSPNSITELTFRDAVDEALNASQNAVLSGWTPSTSWTVVTGDLKINGQPVQEFLTPTPVAEPASILSTGTFLLGAWMLFRRSRTAKLNPRR